MTYESSIRNQYISWKDTRVLQGDILEQVSFTIGGINSQEKLAGEYYKLKYAVVMSQDCDLQWHSEAVASGDLESRALLKTVLVCPAYAFDQFLQGSYIEGANYKQLSIGGKNGVDLKRNDKYKRYHFLDFNEEAGVNDLIIDFKEFYTVPYSVIEDTRKTSYVATINEMFRENLSQRFANYISRIGLPEL